MDYPVIGDHVNLACRLCDFADPGEIIISESTAKSLTHGTFKLIKKDPVQVKGKENPVTIYQVEYL